MIEPRAYRAGRDLEQMLALLAEGRRANNGTYYVHTGDLRWWLFYTTRQRWGDIHLWEDESGALLGWALFSPDWQAFDVFVQPGLRGSTQAEAIYTWSVAGITETVRRAGGKAVRTLWISEKDDVMTGWLGRWGFVPDEEYRYMNYMTRSLADSLPGALLPAGFLLRPVAGEGDLAQRAAAQHAAFESSMPMDEYCRRYLRFMRSPVYRPELDIVAAAPDGRIAAFCIAWLDAANRVGLFEPVGVHPDFQRRGLGKAVVLEGLRRMQANGMEQAIVCSLWHSPAALALYESAGFRTVDTLQAYTKEIQDGISIYERPRSQRAVLPGSGAAYPGGFLSRPASLGCPVGLRLGRAGL